MFIEGPGRRGHNPRPMHQPPDKPEVIGQRLKAARIALGYGSDTEGRDQKAFAESCGISPQAWNNWERGRHRPSLGEVSKLRPLGITTEFVFYGDLSKMPHDLAMQVKGILESDQALEA